MSYKNIVMGVDIGGTHITCAHVDLKEEKIIAETRTASAVNSSGSKEEILKKWTDTISEACSSWGKPSAIGVAIPGPFDYVNGISKIKGVGKYESLYDCNIKKIFASAAELPEEKIKFINDAAGFALGEYYAGAGRNCTKLVAITLGTGFGSAFLSEGKVVAENDGVPEGGMFWNVPYKESIANDYFSTEWFIDNYFNKTGLKVSGVSEIAWRVKGDKNAQNLFNEFAYNLSWFLMPWLNLFNAEKLVVGGNIARVHELFIPLVEYAFAKDGISTRIEISKLWEDAALIGSANLFK